MHQMRFQTVYKSTNVVGGIPSDLLDIRLAPPPLKNMPANVCVWYFIYCTMYVLLWSQEPLHFLPTCTLLCLTVLSRWGNEDTPLNDSSPTSILEWSSQKKGRAHQTSLTVRGRGHCGLTLSLLTLNKVALNLIISHAKFPSFVCAQGVNSVPQWTSTASNSTIWPFN